MREKLHILIFLVFSAGLFPLSATPQDSIEVSLLTCSPGEKVYELYGHTAIRCRDFSRGTDVVFNYGVFSFEQPHFIWRFLRGKCDYMVQPIPWRYFAEDYEERGSSVTAQVIDLRPEEASLLLERLWENCRPENREYRYNFLTNNCTSMVLRQLEGAIDGTVTYGAMDKPETYRQILHHYTASHPWAQEGNDLLIGATMDTVLSLRAAMFAPEYAMRHVGSAVILGNDGSMRPLVKDTQTLVPLRPSRGENGFSIAPIPLMCIVVTLFLTIALIEQKTRRMWWPFDVAVMLVHGIAGLIVCFLFFFSEHPGVGSNWQAIVLNPYPLAGIPLLVKAAWRDVPTAWHAVNFMILTLFMLFSPWMPQDLGNLVVPLTLALLTRPVSYYLHFKRKETIQMRKKGTRR